MRTIELGSNPLPVTFNVRALLPAGSPGGFTDPTAGLTVKVIGVEVDPSGFVTIT